MVHNTRYKCSVCQSVINLRIQIGYVEKVVFYINCPKCTTESAIELKINQIDTSIQIHLVENALDVEKSNPFIYDYSIEASADLPSISSIHADPIQVSSPFMRVVSMYRNLECHEKFISDLAKNQKLENDIVKYKSLLRLYVNGKDEYLDQQLRLFVPEIEYEKSEARETFIALFSEFIANFTNYKAKIIVRSNIKRTLNSIKKSNSDFDDLFDTCIDMDFIDEQLRVLMIGIINYLEKVNEFYPLIVTRYFKEEPSDEYFEGNYVATIKLKDLKELYVGSYEAVGKVLNLIFALHGLKHYSISDVRIGGKPILKILGGEFCSIGNKLADSSKYGIENIVPNISLMDSKLRNGFEHIDYMYDEVGKLVIVNETIQYSQLKIAYMIFKLFDTLVFLFEYTCFIKEQYISPEPTK